MSTQLDPSYFKAPRAWWFNSRDLFIYYYVAAAVLACAFIVSLLLLAMPRSTSNAAVQVTPDPVTTPSVSVSLEPESAALSESAVPVPTVEDLIAEAESQPVLPLKMEAYAQILSDPSLSAADKARVDKAYQGYRSRFQQAQKQLQQVESHMNKDYYSAGIQLLGGILAQGESLGQLHTQALELQEKIHLRRIDYYLLKNQLTQAQNALKEARATQIDVGLLDEYAQKIRQLQAVGP